LAHLTLFPLPLTPILLYSYTLIGVLDPLVLMSRSEDVMILREVAAALNNLSSVEENKMEVADRGMTMCCEGVQTIYL
jgi:hypothetical protein